MVHPRFDPSEAVKFDLVRGRVALDPADSRLLVPASALLTLCQTAGEQALREFGRQLGSEAGRRVAERLGRSTAELSIEGMVEHLGGDLALIGLGSLALERWGRALVFTIDESPLGGKDGDALLAAVLQAALGRALGREAHVVPLFRDTRQVRLLVASAAAATKVRSWLAEGVSWGEVLSKLNGGARGEA